jgi:hypothetical protein
MCSFIEPGISNVGKCSTEMRGADGTTKIIPSIFSLGAYEEKMKERMSNVYSD